MASKVEGPLDRRRHALQIVDGRDLGGNARLKGHVEVFLPANDRVVGATEGEIGAAGGEAQGAGGELLLGGLVEVVHVAAYAHVAEARARHDGSEQADESLGIPEVPGHGVEVLRPKELPHGHAVEPAHPLARPAEVREAGEHEAVHLGERALGERLELAGEIPEEVPLL